MDQWIAVYLYHGIPTIYKTKESNVDTRNHVYETHDHYAQWKKPHSRRLRSIWFLHKGLWKRQCYGDFKYIRGWDVGRAWDPGTFFEVMKKFYFFLFFNLRFLIAFFVQNQGFGISVFKNYFILPMPGLSWYALASLEAQLPWSCGVLWSLRAQ